MLKRALIAVAVLAIAAPGLAAAKGKKAAADETAGLPTGPVAYSDLAGADAKINGPAPKHHAAKKKAAKAAADADASKPAQ
jgi:hypothetical protein